MSDDTTKTCTKCNRDLPLSEFYNNANGRYGKHSRCKDCLRAKSIAYNAAHKEERAAYDRAWRIANSERVTKRHRDYVARRYSDDSRFRMDSVLRKAIYIAVRSEKAGNSWESLVGYSLDDLMEHLESQFTEGMSWDNYGRYGWHIDHIVPKSWFSYESPDDPAFRECWALSNLQPLWHDENIAKGNRRVG